MLVLLSDVVGLHWTGLHQTGRSNLLNPCGLLRLDWNLDSGSGSWILYKCGSERLFSWMYPMISWLWVWVCTRSQDQWDLGPENWEQDRRANCCPGPTNHHLSPRPTFVQCTPYFLPSCLLKKDYNNWLRNCTCLLTTDNGFSVKCFV